MILFHPPASVDSTSEAVIRVGAQSRQVCCTSIATLPNIQVVPVFASTLLARSPEFWELAEEVAAGLPGDPDFSDNWIAELVENFASFNDD